MPRELSLRPLPLQHAPYALPRLAGVARTVAPATPFADAKPVLAGLREIGDVWYDPTTKRAVVRVGPDRAGLVPAALSGLGVAGLGVTIELESWPGNDLAPRDVRALSDAGVAMLKIDSGGPAAHTLTDWFELGKAALAHGLPLHWSGRIPADARAQGRHLTPARDDAAWRSNWRYGMLSWRRGPGFALVEDARAPGVRQQHALDLTVLQGLFGEALDQYVAVSGENRSLLDQLVDLALVAVLESHAVWLPYRMRRWPVNAPI